MENYVNKRLNGRYELVKLIGSGGMANVFEAEDLLEHKTVAIKLLKEEYLTNEEFVRRFRNESRVIAALDHPNVVKVFDVNFTGADQYIVMEYIDGITMRQYIAHQGQLRWKDAVHFTTQILKALSHAHENGVIHRDIKSQNIMLLRDGTIKVMDFGIARFAREDIRTGNNCAIGSVHYISPEQARGEESDERSDIYSVGVLLYEMLTGSVPFDGDTPEEIAMKHISSRPEPIQNLVEGVPTGICEITEKAMQKDQKLRYHSALEMLQAIEKFKQNPNIVFEYQYMADMPAAHRYSSSVSEIQAEEQPDEEQNVEDEEKIIVKRSPTILILTGIAAACIITALLVLMGFFYYGQEEKVGEIVMPNLVGEDYDSVRKKEEYTNFHFIVIENDLSEFPKGQIYFQSIEPGIKVKNNRRIQVKVSAGIEVLEVPPLEGLYVGEAEDQLAALGLEPIIRTQKDTGVEPDRVIKTDPPAGQQVEQGTQVTLYVSRAQIASVVKVPLLIGYDIEKAKAKLETLDLKLEIEEVDSEEKKGVVVEQSLPQNEYAQSKSTITLKVSNGSDYKIESALTVDFPVGLPDEEMTLSVYMDGEEILKEAVNPGLTSTWVGEIGGQEVQEVSVFINDRLYAMYEVNFEDQIATLTDGYHVDIFGGKPEPESSDPSVNPEGSSEPEGGTPSEPSEPQEPSGGEMSGGNSPENAEGGNE